MSDEPQDARWTRIRERLRHSMLRLEASETRADRHRQAVYHQRAVGFAATGRSIAPATTDLTKTLMFDLGDQQYGVSLGNAVKIFPLLPCTPVPRAPLWLLGVSNFDSHIRPVLDLRALVENAAASDWSYGQIVLIRSQQLLFGAYVGRVLGVQDLDDATLKDPGNITHRSRGGVIRGVSPEGVQIICLEALTAKINIGKTAPC